MVRLSPIEEDGLVEQLVQLQLTESQWASLARSINEYPHNVYTLQQNNEEKANLLVSRANQKELCHVINDKIKLISNPSNNGVQQQTSLDTMISTQFGKLFEDLLRELEKLEDSGDLLPSINSEDQDHIEFRKKLDEKAKFQKSTIEIGVEHRIENSVLQRKAMKLGYKKYKTIEQRVAQLYVGILDEYPVDDFQAEKRLKGLLEKLYVLLPEEDKFADETLDHLYGIIFGTAARCLIFNE